MSDKDNINREYLEMIMNSIESQQHLLPIENRMDDKFLSILRDKLELAINDSMILYLKKCLHRLTKLFILQESTQHH